MQRVKSSTMEVGRDVGAVSQAVRVLRVLSKADTPMSLTEIRTQADIIPSTCLNILRTLNNTGLVGFDAKAKEYWIDLGLLDLARPLIKKSKVELLRSHLEALANQGGGVITVWRIVGDETLVMLDKIVPDVDVRLEFRMETKIPVGTGSVGRAVVAAMDLSEGERRRLYSQVKWEWIPGFQTFNREVKTAEQNGYAIDIGQTISGISTVGSCITGPDKKPWLGLSIAMIQMQKTDEQIHRLGEELADFCSWATRAIYGEEEPVELPKRNA